MIASRTTVPLEATYATDDGTVTEVNGIPADSVMCDWFALCTRGATHFEPHSIRTYVPCCDACCTIGR